MAKKKKVEKFSVVKAIKSNARDRVGTIPVSQAFTTKPERDAVRPKHKKTFAQLINSDGLDD